MTDKTIEKSTPKGLKNPRQKVIHHSPSFVGVLNIPHSVGYNSDALECRRPIVGNVMEALADPNTHLIGVYGSDDNIKDTLLQRVNRRIQRDNLFDLVLTVSVRKKPNMKNIQKEIARQLGLNFNHKSKYQRAQQLIERIKIEQKVLIVLCDLYKRLDLSKIGILYGSDHTGCKILLTSITENVLSNHMHTQRNFMKITCETMVSEATKH